ncbi:hypothetical protein QT969_05010 [Rhodococcus sp. CSLK01-03]|uniref:Uncharacterized protein n=1 Tax=Rhodococcus indonesiensis TaxID=3055869 RepID=A0ABT7RJ37_9NOCA|nr:hypothetical protein [Rhodococcus indonesiensis]MDM7487635.1 hypothetical protein [Rhodococcus indonesiensis]
MSTRRAANGRIPTMTTEEIKVRIAAMFDYESDVVPAPHHSRNEPPCVRSATGSSDT